MKVLDAIRACAKRDLSLVDASGRRDTFLWESACRIANTTQLLLTVPEVQRREPGRTAALAAAYYCDAGYLTGLANGAIHTSQLRAATTGADHHNFGAEMLRRCLADVLDAETLDAAALAIRTLPMRRLHTPEAMVVSDAENLDRIGVLSLWTAARTSVNSGRGLDDVLTVWHSQRAYKYWPARIADAFHFDATRRLALERLDFYAAFMEQLERSHSGVDLVECLNNGGERVVVSTSVASAPPSAATSPTVPRRSPQASP